MIVLWFLIKIFFGRLLEVYIFPCIQFCFQFWKQNWKQLETTGNKTGNKTGNNWYKTGNNWIQKLDTTGDSWHFMNSQPIKKIYMQNEGMKEHYRSAIKFPRNITRYLWQLTNSKPQNSGPKSLTLAPKSTIWRG